MRDNISPQTSKPIKNSEEPDHSTLVVETETIDSQGIKIEEFDINVFKSLLEDSPNL